MHARKIDFAKKRQIYTCTYSSQLIQYKVIQRFFSKQDSNIQSRDPQTCNRNAINFEFRNHLNTINFVMLEYTRRKNIICYMHDIPRMLNSVTPTDKRLIAATGNRLKYSSFFCLTLNKYCANRNPHKIRTRRRCGL